jgi:hypothetical protein
MKQKRPIFVGRFYIVWMRIFAVLVSAFLLACAEHKEYKLFDEVSHESGIFFENKLSFTDQFNPYTYRNFYNGAGVAIGDINNDGLLDIYFAGNQVDNKLYLNQGNFKFIDVTVSAGVACHNVWSTGVSFADINADGYLDLYVCKSGPPGMPNRHNELFINNGDLTFTERAKEYGLDVTGLSVQATFFDYDKDDDLDCYLLTNSFKSIGNFDFVPDQRQIPDPYGGNRFFINDNGKFKDHTQEAGIYSSSIGFGLGVTLGDFNQDSWIDIFVSNDFFERDYLYINDNNGRFVESLTKYFESVSMGSMGADMADLDGDGIGELFVTEMLPDLLSRRKNKMMFESWDRYQLAVKQGYHHQFARNVLQKQLTNEAYAEVGRFAGVSASDWSWGALLFDMDNDGLRDIFIATGIRKDLLDRDYLSYTASEQNIRQLVRTDSHTITKLINEMPTSVFSNYSFRNFGNLTFKNMSMEWGLNNFAYSSGSAYGDLDNDGDLDLVINNLDAPAFVYENNTDTNAYKSLTISFKSSTKNTKAIGATIKAYADGKLWVADNTPVKGYQSSVQPRITVGVGATQQMDSVRVFWPNGRTSTFANLPLNENIELSDDSAVMSYTAPIRQSLSFKLRKIDSFFFRHNGSDFVDFNRDRLLPMMYSNETPFLSKVDVDGNGVQEVYVGGGKDQSGEFISINNDLGKFKTNFVGKDNLPEESEGVFFDVDKDGDSDFYFSSGGRLFPIISNAQRDVLFINIGDGTFKASPHRLPLPNFSTSVAKPLDANKDGNLDLFVASRFDPFAYGRMSKSFLLINDGAGNFSIDDNWNVEGMITDAEVVDLNNDGWDDLVIVGDWMTVAFYENMKGLFKDVSSVYNIPRLRGWWRSLESSDLNHDNRPDFVIANHGLNSFFRAKDRIYVSDFDGNGSVEQIYCTNIDGKYYPIHDKDELLSQLPYLKKSLVYYKDYSNKSVDMIFTPEQMEQASVLEVDTLSSVMLLSSNSGYSMFSLPSEAQYSPLYAILVEDLDDDGVLDIIAGGNQYGVKPQFGRLDASQGWFFKGKFKTSRFSLERGISLNVRGQIRDIETVNFKNKKYLIFAKHDDMLEVFEVLH